MKYLAGVNEAAAGYKAFLRLRGPLATQGIYSMRRHRDDTDTVRLGRFFNYAPSRLRESATDRQGSTIEIDVSPTQR